MKISLIIDIIIVLVFLVSTIYGIKKGFIHAAYQIISLALTLFVVFALRAPTAKLLKNSIVGQSIETSVTSSIDKALGQADFTGNISEAIAATGLPDFVTEGAESAAASVEESREECVKALSAEITDTVTVSLAAVTLFILTKIILSLLIAFLEKMCRLPLIKEMNRIAGGIVGALNALIMICIAAEIVMLCLPPAARPAVNEVIDQTHIATFFYRENILMRLFTNELGMGRGVDMTSIR